MLYRDYLAFPLDSAGHDLAEDLSEYVPVGDAFRCPSDAGSEPNSYQAYYVARPGDNEEMEFVIGCPRHRNVSQAVNLFSKGNQEGLTLGSVAADGNVVAANATDAERTISSGTFTFEAGTSATITAANPGYGVTLIESFRLADGTLYSLIRVAGDGTVDVTVTPGQRFEVVTPSAIVGVRGTRFTITTSNNGA